jgi:hypothetical protein
MNGLQNQEPTSIRGVAQKKTSQRGLEQMSNPDIVNTDWLTQLLTDRFAPTCEKECHELHFGDDLERASAQVLAKFKENYKRLALELIGEKEKVPNTPNDYYQSTAYWKGRNQVRVEQTEKLMNQLNNMKGE